ncbi:hypothetical protein A2467_01570 [Candidatus Nomurabacteria bacterium RIFOXYC2_FULL_36_8]|nr:MAG: hypothetical protein US00_C0012G0002 [Candidatus Nomurabacteria bacterium GW2011_GWF2_36_126]KKP96272.1 MAG: hypothetical protein US04_C0003G0003 [Candidatus Nomurabacteria bacterium GW2011_GWD2_36_14]KKQ04845.1 MAG: hypothetical protein US17_C0013G0002 [Candidatus Nomurabacteria bacterium GW2011_GWF1_36_47]KKQ08317.1 MAG: hypothetical protein US21_C0018G0003 [Candidatus Nomurabacteria bacterium GW2011_GWB1_36_6]KKQ12278.1 MAG: hypothetical protein US26_C0013G0002 [Candidatus Nomurabact
MYKNNKRKILISVFLFLAIVVPQITLASAISLRSSTSTTEPGKTFSLSIYANGSGVASYTAGVTLKFPADLVSVESFNYSGPWIPITASGYDTIDNTSGSLIKTAGYPNGFTNEVLVGTALFKVKKTGAITITTNQASYILDVDSNSTLKTYGSFSVTSSTPVVKTTPPPSTPTPTVTTKPVVKKPATTVDTKDSSKNDSVATQVTPETTPAVLPENKEKTKSIILFFGIIISAISAYLGFQ